MRVAKTDKVVSISCLWDESSELAQSVSGEVTAKRQTHNSTINP